MNRSFWWGSRFLAFYVFFTFEITIVEASPHLFVDQPKGCSANAKRLSRCAISAGDSPYTFYATGSQWEISKHTVVMGRPNNRWKMAHGHFVVKSKDANIVETPFGNIHMTTSDVFIELEEDKVSVSVLSGEPVEFRPRSGDAPLILTPGFRNWYGGIGPEGQTYGMPQVISLKGFAKKRAYFFTDHKLGFVNELKRLAGTIQLATELSAQMHADLVNSKRGLLEEAYQQGVRRKDQQIRYSKDLRRLFRKKMHYDD